MSKDTDQIVVAANGSIKVAEVGTAAPASISAVTGAGWLDLGFASEDGVTFLDGKTVEPIPVWQLFYPARRIVTEKEATVSFVLRQWSTDTVQLAFGGGTVSSDGAGEYRYTPPEAGTIDERSLIVEWVDGDKNYRLIIPRGMVTENVETNLVKTAAADLPITFGVNGEEGVAPWYFQTDDPALAPAAS